MNIPKYNEYEAIEELSKDKNLIITNISKNKIFTQS